MGACFHNFTGSGASPIRQCTIASSRRACFGDSDCVGFSWPEPTLDEDKTIPQWEIAGCIQGKGRMVSAPVSLEYFHDETCGQVIEREGVKTFGACCHDRFAGSLTDREAACRHYSPEECVQGWIAQLRSFFNNRTAETKRCWVLDAFIESTSSIFVGQSADPADGCDFLVANIRTPGLSKFLGTTVTCRCTSTQEPFMPQIWVDAGFTSCVRNAQDNRSWEEACDLEIVDELPCRTRGFPLVIEDDGHAAFYGGHRKVQQSEGGDNGCRHILTELFVDGSGLTHSLGCTKIAEDGTVVTMVFGDLGDHPAIRCNSMYTDMGFDNDFNCDN